jgi:ATP-dependent Clp protease ATP-binding subunit ClpC
MAYRFPILALRDAAGLHTATLVDGGGAGTGTAVAATSSEARGLLRDFLERHYRANPWDPPPDFAAPRLSLVKVDVRPEYEATGGRVHPCGEAVPLRVPVVTGRTEAGLLVAACPTLGLQFSYHADDDLRPLIVQYVQGRLKGHTPAQIVALLPPPLVELDDVVIQAPREPRTRTAGEADLGELPAVADALGARELRTRFSRAWQREDVVTRLVEALRREAAPILLLGEPGVGKTSVLADAVRRLEREAGAAGGARTAPPVADDASPRGRRGHRFRLTSAARLIAGMQYLGMWQERVEEVIARLASISGVLCAENLLDLARTGGRGAADSIGAFLVPYLQRGELRLVSEATPAELDALRRLLPSLADLFQVIAVPPLDRPKAVECLSQVAAARRQARKVEVDRGVVQTVHRLFARFMPYHPFPGRAAAFVEELIDRTRDASDPPAAPPRVRPDDAIDLFVARTGLPELFLRDDLPLDPAAVTATLHRDVIGQERACRAAASVVTTFKAGLNDPNRPLGVLLFAGPTGVGKTQLAQSIAKFLFGASPNTGAHDSPAPSSPPSRLIRLDMSEYAGADAADRFLGSADGGGPADWIQRVRRQPFCVLLLDEVEKASPDVFDVLLGAFDEGRLTDPWGRLTHLKSAVIVMTTNLGSSAGEAFGLSRAPAAPAYEGEAMGFFRPEFFNRIDAVVAFDPLSPAHVRAIAAKELADLATREGLAKLNVRLRWTDRLLDRLAADGYDARYGARPLQRALETRVVTPLAKHVVRHAPAPGATLLLDVGPDGDVSVSTSA